MHYDPDVACLQEVDKFEEHHRPNLAAAGYDTLYTTGYSAKLHGLCIAWKRSLLEQVGDRCVKLDEAEVEPGRTACSRVTRNIGLLAALQWRDSDKIANAPKGIIVVTRGSASHMAYYGARRQLTSGTARTRCVQSTCFGMRAMCTSVRDRSGSC